MYGFNWFDQRGRDGLGRIRALHTLLTNYLPHILPNMRESLVSKMTEILKQHQSGDGSG